MRNSRGTEDLFQQKVMNSKGTDEFKGDGSLFQQKVGRVAPREILRGGIKGDGISGRPAEKTPVPFDCPKETAIA